MTQNISQWLKYILHTEKEVTIFRYKTVVHIAKLHVLHEMDSTTDTKSILYYIVSTLPLLSKYLVPSK